MYIYINNLIMYLYFKHGLTWKHRGNKIDYFDWYLFGINKPLNFCYMCISLALTKQNKIHMGITY